MRDLKLVLEILKKVQGSWADMSTKHRQAARSSKAELTQRNHEKEESYYHGKADGVRQALEMISDYATERRMDYDRRARVTRQAAQGLMREVDAAALEGRTLTDAETQAIWKAEVAQAVNPGLLDEQRWQAYRKTEQHRKEVHEAISRGEPNPDREALARKFWDPTWTPEDDVEPNSEPDLNAMSDREIQEMNYRERQ